jgi:2-oxoglutarate ferredoxin oxidoreductase subunit beta
MGARAGESHPIDPFIKSDSILNAWCPGCGIGTTLNVFFQSVIRAGVEPGGLFVVCGLGCSGRIADSMSLQGDKVVDGSPFEHAAQFKQKHPAKKVVVFLSDADFIAYGVDGFVEAARLRPDIPVIYINNLIYPIVYHEIAALPSSNGIIYESRELPFNIPHMALSCGAEYVARWTTIHTKRLSFSIADVLKLQKFSVIEVIAPCLMYCTKYYNMKESLDRSRRIEKARLNHDEIIS